MPEQRESKYISTHYLLKLYKKLDKLRRSRDYWRQKAEQSEVLKQAMLKEYLQDLSRCTVDLARQERQIIALEKTIDTAAKKKPKQTLFSFFRKG